MPEPKSVEPTPGHILEKYEEKSKPYVQPKIGLLNSPYTNKAGSLPDPVRHQDLHYRSGRGIAYSETGMTPPRHDRSRIPKRTGNSSGSRGKSSGGSKKTHSKSKSRPPQSVTQIFPPVKPR